MNYYEFKYIETKEAEIINQGDALYYTSAEKDLEEMKNHVRSILQNPLALISIPYIKQIDRDTFIYKGGNPNVY